MATRSVSWRRSCPDGVERCIDQVSGVTLYIVHQTGPTGFILKEEGVKKKLKVYLGDPHMCSCSAFKRSRELCVHIIWVLLKKFRVPRANPIVWQLGLIEREINEVIRGHLIHQSPTPPKDHTPSSQSTEIPQREIGPDDVCPICQDDLLGSTRKVTYCRFSCGKSVHVRCMKIWSDHQKSTGESVLRCPLCRENFGAIVSVAEARNTRLTGSEQDYRHLGVACSECHVCPVVGKCYKCCVCDDYVLCHTCFTTTRVHLGHSFKFRQHSSHPWRAASRSSDPAHPPGQISRSHTLSPSLVNTLQSRTLSENDYELLLNLDLPQPSQLTRPGVNRRQHPPRDRDGVAERVMMSLHVEPLDGHHPLVVGGACCRICQQNFVRGDWIKKLPCKHKFHRHCLDAWLDCNTTCPIDNKPVCNPSQSRPAIRHTSHPAQDTTHSLAPRRRLAPLGLESGGVVLGMRMAIGSHDQNTDISVSGHGFRNATEKKRKSSNKAFSTSSLPSLLTATPLSLSGTSAILSTSVHQPHPPHQLVSVINAHSHHRNDFVCGVGVAGRRGCSLGGRVRRGLNGPVHRNRTSAGTSGGELLVTHLNTSSHSSDLSTNHTLPVRTTS